MPLQMPFQMPFQMPIQTPRWSDVVGFRAEVARGWGKGTCQVGSWGGDTYCHNDCYNDRSTDRSTCERLLDVSIAQPSLPLSV